MADRYWVGGSGTWDDSSTTHWSTSSGGAAGASAPLTSSIDRALFDANSGGGTVNVTATDGGSGNSYTLGASGFTGAFTGTLRIAASPSTIGSTANYTAFNPVFTSSSSGATLTTNNKTFGSITVRGESTGESSYVIFTGQLNTTGALTFQAGADSIQLRLDTVTNSIGSLVCNQPYDPFSDGWKNSIISKTTGSQATLSCNSGTNILTYLKAKDIAFTGGATWLVGTNFVDLGNNTGLSSGTASYSLFFGSIA